MALAQSLRNRKPNSGIQLFLESPAELGELKTLALTLKTEILQAIAGIEAKL